MSDEHPRWTEIEHLPEWDEEFYHIYTAKKFGKWVMMKTLRPEYADDPRYQAMIEQEFDVRYSLAHPNRATAPPARQRPRLHTVEAYRTSGPDARQHHLYRKYRQSQAYRCRLRTAAVAVAPVNGRRHIQLRQGARRSPESRQNQRPGVAPRSAPLHR